MSKVPKWKVEKNKVKVVFRLQFHATHIPQAGWDKLVLAFVPHETGKASAKTNKASVRSGGCRWADPIYEATRLLQDARTGRVEDKVYKLVVSMGSSRSSVLGEADLNLAEFVDALKPTSVALPLHGCDFGTVLHVTVQILTTKTGFREFEQQSVRPPQIISTQSSSDTLSPPSDEKITIRLRLKETNSESTEDGIDGSSHTSDSLHAEKTEMPLFPLTHKTENSDFAPINRLGSNDWTPTSWASDLENSDLALAYEENNRLRVRLEVAESAFLQLKSEAKSLQRITDDLGAETQSLACQLAAELDSGQTLSSEVSVLKTECTNLKRDVRELGLEKPGNRFLNSSDKGLSSQALVLIENKVHEIRDKACIGFRAGFDFLDPDLDALLNYINGLKQGLESNQDEDPLIKKEKMCELLQKLEDSKTENEILVKKMNQMERYYESFIHQLEQSQKETVKELETLKEDRASSLYTTGALQSQIEKLSQEMEGQLARSDLERKKLEGQLAEMERRAVASESALKRVRRNYTGAVERLQKDLELLSFQVLSMYETSETLVKQPVADFSDLDLNLGLKKQVCLNGGSVDLEEGRGNGKPRCIDIRANNDDDELLDVYVSTVQLRVFSDLLVGALNCVNNGASEMGKRKIELETELVELDRSLRESEAVYVSKCDELAVRVQILEGKLRSMTEERDRFESLLAVEMTEKGHFESKIVNLGEEFRVLREEKFELESKLKEAELDLEASRRKLLEGIKEKDSFEAEIGALVQEINALKEENSVINEDKEMVEKMKDNFEAEIGALVQEMNALKEENSVVNQEKETEEKMKVDFENKWQDATEASEMQKRENNELMVKLKLVEIELEQVSDESKCIVQNLQNELGVLKEEKVNLEGLVRKAELDLQERESELGVLKEEKVNLEGLIKKTELDLQERESELGVLKEEKFNLEGLVKKTELDLQERESELGVLKEEIVNLEGLLKKTESDLQEVLEKFQMLKNEKRELMENKSLENEVNNLRELKASLESDLEASRRKEDDLSRTVEKLEREVLEVRESFSVRSESEQKHVKSNSELLSKLELMELNLVNCENELQRSKIRVSNCEDELERSKVRVSNCEEEKIGLENELEILREKKGIFENLVKKAESDLEASLSTIEKLERELKEVRELHANEKTDLVSKLETREIELKDSDIFRGQFENIKLDLVKSEEEKRNLEKEMQILGKAKVDFENSLKKAELDLDLSTKTIEKLEQELSEVREIHANEKTNLFSKLEMREIELKDSDIFREEFERTKLDLIKSQENLEKELQISEKTKVDFENLQLEFQEATERFEKENSELKSKFEIVQFELEQVRNECTDLNQKVHESERNIEEHERNKEILQNEMDELNLNFNLNLSKLNAQLEERENEMVLFYDEKTKLTERIMELEKANILMQNIISRNEENNRDLEIEFENRLILVLQELVASDVEASYMQSELRELNSQFNSFKNELKNEFQNESEISRFKDTIHTLQKEVESSRVSKEEAEILDLILKSKLEEQNLVIFSLKQSKNELGDLRENQRALTRRLSEQTLKTEEYKNLSLHFKEKSEEQNINQSIEKREKESLRIAFIKEQYESKIQEMKTQSGASKKYAEEMLVKLQNTLNELEIAKKNEISLAKRIEQLSVDLSELERELQEIRADKREILSDYDNLKAELECKNMSFDCLKEEKQKLELGFQECNEERRKLKVEIDLVKRLMENMAMAGNGDLQLSEGNGSNGSIGEILQGVGSPIKARSVEKCEELDGDKALKDEHIEKHQKLKVALSLFQKELEKLKNENISYLIPQDGDQLDPSLHGLERALSQLDTANEHLGSIFPSFKELSGSGNSLERVLALELELAEALQEKKRTDTRFQSSFLRQHKNDSEAIFQSFRDLNELIQDTLQLKKRHVSTESELREMHGRYSQLSVQFAELEGERQKLVMALKNRSPRKM